MIFVSLFSLSLSVWQFDRAKEKKLLFQKKIERSKKTIQLSPNMMPTTDEEVQKLDQQLIKVSGNWINNSTIYIDNRSYLGSPGVHVLSAFKMSEFDSLIWVNRGWAKKLPGNIENIDNFITGNVFNPTNDNLVETHGVLQSDLMKRMELTSSSKDLNNGNLWQNLSWSRLENKVLNLRKEKKINMWPLIVWQSKPKGKELNRVLPFIKNDMQKHISYALQWILISIVAIFFSWRLSK